MSEKVAIKLRIILSNDDLKEFDPKTASISIEGAKLEVIDSPKPFFDFPGTYWFLLSNIDKNKKYSKVSISATGLKKPIKIKSFNVAESEAKALKTKEEEEKYSLKLKAKREKKELKRLEKKAFVAQEVSIEAQKTSSKLKPATEEEQLKNEQNIQIKLEKEAGVHKSSKEDKNSKK